MIESKKGNITLTVASTKATANCAVSMCFDMEVNCCSLSRLSTGGCCCESKNIPKGTEEACLGYSLFLMVEQILCGNPKAVASHKVGSVVCGAHNGMFFINWDTKGTVSSVRKSIGSALKVLKPARMYPIYQKHMKELGISPSKDNFAYVADMANKSIKSHLYVFAVGNVKADKDKVEDMLDVIVKKLDLPSVDGSKSKPTEHINCKHEDQTEIKVSGWQSAVLTNFIKTYTKCSVYLCDKYLLLPIKESVWETQAKKTKEYAKDYAVAKYSKAGKDVAEIFAYTSIINGMLCGVDAKAAIKDKLSVDSVKSAITRLL